MITIRLTHQWVRAATAPPAACEWLVTDGRGGYASGTLAGCNTRKYHGLLVSNLGAPANGRHVLVSGLGEAVEVGGVRYPLSGEAFRGGLPDCVLPTEFADLAIARWDYRLGAVSFTRELTLAADPGAVLLRYTLSGGDGDATLTLAPRLAYRRNHALSRANPFFRAAIETAADGFRIAPYDGMPALCVQVRGGVGLSVAGRGDWLRDVWYPVEAERGYDAHEDLFVPAAVTVSCRPGEAVYVALASAPVADVAAAWEVEGGRRRVRRRRAREFAAAQGASPVVTAVAECLFAAADQFLVTVPPARRTVIAGYHWFEDWGRDTLIALPGLSFVRGELADGFAVLRTFASYARGARLPNYIGPAGEAPSYNSVDAALWFFWAVQQYLAHGGGAGEVECELWPSLKQLLAGLADGSDPLIAMSGDGLLRCGDRGTQLTWMDAEVGGRPVTPRWGWPVEINALWYNAICFSTALARRFGDGSFRPPARPETVAAAFVRRFWVPELGCLADVVNEDGVSRDLRPNQVFAVSLPFSPLPAEMAAAVVGRVGAELLTPRGLRTLAPGSPAYRARYEGGTEARDHAYHQGTVWPWLLGAFGEASLRVNGGSAVERARWLAHLAGWAEHLCEAGLGTVSEVFDAEAPHAANGCIAQAWSVAELLRLLRLSAGPAAAVRQALRQ
ncbi:MAG: Amylo-alpha-1,6-glucosidase [Lentisphaerae bacterium ADurb.BinA184]|nr:MAG: Amylo-alpha-1,6-glucosidase [Lentisphaerae bacterium ADurb.BinA184]